MAQGAVRAALTMRRCGGIGDLYRTSEFSRAKTELLFSACSGDGSTPALNHVFIEGH